MLHPCAFFSRRLTAAERNYEGNRELLALVLALQKLSQWLEGSAEPFVVWTNHKNLAYLQRAKRLNTRQARWALFLSCFSFTLTYRPGFKNPNPDALSQQFAGTNHYCSSTKMERWLCHLSGPTFAATKTSGNRYVLLSRHRGRRTGSAGSRRLLTIQDRGSGCPQRTSRSSLTLESLCCDLWDRLRWKGWSTQQPFI